MAAILDGAQSRDVLQTVLQRYTSVLRPQHEHHQGLKCGGFIKCGASSAWMDRKSGDSDLQDVLGDLFHGRSHRGPCLTFTLPAPSALPFTAYVSWGSSAYVIQQIISC